MNTEYIYRRIAHVVFDIASFLNTTQLWVSCGQNTSDLSSKFSTRSQIERFEEVAKSIGLEIEVRWHEATQDLCFSIPHGTGNDATIMEYTVLKKLDHKIQSYLNVVWKT
tara:strand:- start:7710 stop:8039 length:330 start_codon:yes stop_codon:yes gene_type:complete